MRYLALSILVGAFACNAQPTDLLSGVISQLLPYDIVSKSAFIDNAAAMTYRDSISLSAVDASVVKLDDKSPICEQCGTGQQYVAIDVRSYKHLDDCQTVWGNAGFSTGKIFDIKWSNCIDYELISPYVLGDEVGGDLSFRRYVFGGGYSRREGERLHLGATLSYRAEIAWRTIDPRIKTVVSDLQTEIGASYRLNESHAVGLSSAIRTYAQNCDLDFYNPMNDINTLPLTGFGTYNKRFAGNTNKNSGHSGLGYSIGCQLFALQGHGISVTADYQGMRMSQQLRNFNNITLAYTDTHCFSGCINYGVTTRNQRIRTIPALRFDLTHRRGTENLFGTAAGASYDKIGSHSPYRNDNMAIALILPVEFRLGSGILTATPTADYRRCSESLSTLSRKMHVDGLTSGTALQYLHSGSLWSWVADAHCSYNSTLSRSLNMPDGDAPSSLQSNVVNTYDMLSADSWYSGAKLTIIRAFSEYIAGLSLEYSHTSYDNHRGSNLINATINIKF